MWPDPATVYRATDPQSGADVAIKLMARELSRDARVREINRALSPAWQPIIDRAMAKKREDRYPTASLMAAAVAAIATPAPKPDSTLVKRRTNTRVWGAMAVVALFFLVGSGALVALRNGGQQAESMSVAVSPTVATVTVPASVTGATRPPLQPTSTLAGAVGLTPSPIGPPRFRLHRDTELAAGPGALYDTLAELNVGQEMIVLGSSSTGAWYNVRLDDGRTGWVTRASGALLDPAGATSILPARTVPVPPATSTRANATATATAAPTSTRVLAPLATSPAVPATPAPPTDPPPPPPPTDEPATEPPPPPTASPTSAIPSTDEPTPTPAIPEP